MNRRTMRGWIHVAAVTVLVAAVGERRGSAGEPPPRYMGADWCSQCHDSKATGRQTEAWRRSAHAKAWDTLGSERAAQVAAKYGITEPQSALQCLRCHTTGAGEPKTRFNDNFKKQDGVQCEACHGPGENYAKIAHMIDDAMAAAAGLIDPGPKVCQQCHNDQSPTYKGFDYRAAVEKIRHPLAAY
jgi:hypothetical protein